MFLLTVSFGLFHGLLLFPVFLSLVGPQDDAPSDSSQTPLDHMAKHEGHVNDAFSDVCLHNANTSVII